jgi:hypothetical protein
MAPKRRFRALPTRLSTRGRAGSARARGGDLTIVGGSGGGIATHIVVATQPAGAVTGVAFTTQPVVRLQDALNANVLEAGVTVTAYLSSGSGTLGGTTQVTTNASGIATFTNLSITGTGAHTVSFHALMSNVQSIWSDDVESDRSASYFEVVTAGGAFGRASVDGSMQWRSVQSGAGPEFGNLKLGIGRTPSGVASVGPSGVDFGLVTMEVDIYHSVNNLTDSQDKCLRMSVFSASDWSQAACAHIWSEGGTVLEIDPVTSVVANVPTAVGWNDFAHFTWTGKTAGSTALFGATATTPRRLKVIWRLNDPGQANGTVSMYLDDVLDLQQTGKDFVQGYTGYGINAVHLENYRTAGVVTPNNRMFDNLLVSGRARSVVAANALTVGAGGGGSGGPNEPSGMTLAFNEAWNTTPNGRTGSQNWITDNNPYGGGAFTIVTDATAPISPPNVLQVFYAHAYPGGSGGHAPAHAYYAESGHLPANTGTIYFRVAILLSANWSDGGNAGTKFFFPRSGQAGENNYINLTGGGAFLPGFSINGQTWNGDSGDYPISSAISKGVWHDMEILLYQGTSATAKNGYAKIWIDGTLMLNRTGIQILPSGAPLGFSYLFLDPTYGGGAAVPPADQYFQLDNWYCSVK